MTLSLLNRYTLAFSIPASVKLSRIYPPKLNLSVCAPAVKAARARMMVMMFFLLIILW